MSNVISFSDAKKFRIASQVANATGTHFFKLTPELANSWLKLNTSNRSVSKKNWQRYAREMAAGRWVLNGETIKFSKTGLLIDGQHRLIACSNSGKEVDVEVRFGLPESTFHVIDGGKSRNWADTLSQQGVNNSNLIAAMLTKVIQLISQKRTRKITHESVPPRTEMMKFFFANPDIVEAAVVAEKLYKQFNKVVPASVISSLYYVLYKVNKDLGPKYITSLCNGFGLLEGDPAYAVRNSLIKAKLTANRTMPTTHQIALIIKGWNAFVKGRKMKKASYSPDREKEFPKITGLEIALAGINMDGLEISNK